MSNPDLLLLSNAGIIDAFLFLLTLIDITSCNGTYHRTYQGTQEKETHGITPFINRKKIRNGPKEEKKEFAYKTKGSKRIMISPCTDSLCRTGPCGLQDSQNDKSCNVS